MPKFKLYHYWRSSSSWRVRWALEIKGISYDAIPVNLLNGESESEAHLARNPAGFVPVLEIVNPENALAGPEFLSESLSIIRYLEDLFPEPAVLPGSPLDRAHIWSLAEVINSGTQPIQNIPVMALHSSEPAAQKLWAQHWIRHGLEVYESLCSKQAGSFAYGNTLTLADLCLIPQCYNAERYEVDFRVFPTISRIYDSCINLVSLQKSHPDRFKPAL